MNNSYYLALDGKQAGPFPTDVVAQMIRDGKANAQTLAFTKGMSNWTTLDLIGEFRAQFRSEGSAPPPPMPSMSGVHRRSHEIDFEVFGDDLQFVEVTLDPNETVVAEAGAFMYMSNGVQMETQMGDGSSPDAGLLDTVVQVGKHVL